MKLTINETNSSVIASIEYDGGMDWREDGIAIVTFTNGSVYRYSRVSGEDMTQLLDGERGTLGENFSTFRNTHKQYERIK